MKCNSIRLSMRSTLGLVRVIVAAALTQCSAPKQDSFLNPDASQPCVDGATAGRVCSGSCVDLATNPNHCGRCGLACPQGVECASGACTTSCRPGFITCASGCVDPQTSARFCGATADCMGPNAGRACSAVEHCVSGACIYFEAPRSEVSPYAEAGDFDIIDVPRPVSISIGSILNGVIYYTLDGTEPMPGSPSTQSTFNSAVITVGAADGIVVTLRWFMDYGGFYGREPSVRQRNIRVAPNPRRDAGALYENLQFNGSSATALVAPLSRVTLDLKVQQWHNAPGTGPCPAGCAILQWISVDQTETVAQALPRACEQLNTGQYPGIEDDQRHYTFVAPEQRGRYAVRVGQALDFVASCPRQSRGGTPIAFFYVQ